MKFETLREIIQEGKTEIKRNKHGVIVNFVFRDMTINEVQELSKLINKDIFIENGKLKFNILSYMEGV